MMFLCGDDHDLQLFAPALAVYSGNHGHLEEFSHLDVEAFFIEERLLCVIAICAHSAKCCFRPLKGFSTMCQDMTDRAIVVVAETKRFCQPSAPMPSARNTIGGTMPPQTYIP